MAAKLEIYTIFEGTSEIQRLEFQPPRAIRGDRRFGLLRDPMTMP